MARKRRGTPIHGWLIIDKPSGMSSNAVVGKVLRLTGAAKAGHGGTLDPLATGVLPIALGEATKTVAYIMGGTKTYSFTIRWGEARNTDDAEGRITQTSDVRPATDEIKKALAGFVGEIEQHPPAFSAIKVDGRRAYQLARADQAVELAARTVRVDSFELASEPDADHAEFTVQCGKGTYMRSLARDLGEKLGTFGHITALRRKSVGPFLEESAISLDNFLSVGHSPPLLSYLLPVETALADIPALALTEEEGRQLRQGQPVSIVAVALRHPLKKVVQGEVVCAMAEGRPVALARIAGAEIRPFRVLNL